MAGQVTDANEPVVEPHGCLRAIQTDPNDLDELQRQSDKILGNLRSIQQR
jgi:hypothetical protein